MGLLFFVWATVAGAARICVDITTDFLDADYIGPVEGGDWWEDNDERPARGVRITVNDGAGVNAYYLDNDGCKLITVTPSGPWDVSYTVGVQSRALVNGVWIVATDGVDFDPTTDPANSTSNDPGTVASVTFQVLHSTTHPVLTVNTGDQRWNMLAVAMWAMHRNTFNLGTFSSRECCLETSAGSYDETEGTCDSDPEEQYSDAFSALQGAKTIELISDGSGLSKRDWWDDGWKWEPTVGVQAKLRFLIAHELGHVLVMKRMGDRTLVDLSAPMDGCVGSYRSAFVQLPVGDDFPDPPNQENPTNKGTFTKEYQSSAAREGWATFFAVWLFNMRTETDGQMDWWDIHDLDRDGALDNNYDPDTSDTDNPPTEDDLGDGIIDMRLNPVKVTPHGAVNLMGTDAMGRDWLDRLVAADDNPIPDTVDTGDHCRGSVTNRGTEYDWARFFWDMTLTAEGNIPPEDLADLYINMCPTNWRKNDSGTAGLPIDRLKASALHHGQPIEDQWKDRKIWGQDH